jgi:hypothetical protein
VGEAEEIPLFFTLIPVLALLSNYDQENCLINVGTEGTSGSQQINTLAHRHLLRRGGVPVPPGLEVGVSSRIVLGIGPHARCVPACPVF